MYASRSWHFSLFHPPGTKTTNRNGQCLGYFFNRYSPVSSNKCCQLLLTPAIFPRGTVVLKHTAPHVDCRLPGNRLFAIHISTSACEFVLVYNCLTMKMRSPREFQSRTTYRCTGIHVTVNKPTSGTIFNRVRFHRECTWRELCSKTALPRNRIGKYFVREKYMARWNSRFDWPSYMVIRRSPPNVARRATCACARCGPLFRRAAQKPKGLYIII